jgi:hypothetical protein
LLLSATMRLRRASGARRHGALLAAAQGALALLLLLLPVLDVHADTTLAPVAPGTPIATDAIHPGAATHVESSGTQVTPRCPACDLAQQSAGTLSQSGQIEPAVRRVGATASAASSRPAAPLGTPHLRGPPAS